jgi:DNA mismatch endonuclease (patch repair protein)
LFRVTPMPDLFSAQQRSKIMAAIRSSGNKSTELRMASILRKMRIRGWRRNSILPGRPDFYFPTQRTCVFIHGCFWHACPRCFKMPKSNTRYWHAKIARNQRRDKRVTGKLRRAGYSVIVVWECQLKSEKKVEGVIRRLRKAMARKR